MPEWMPKLLSGTLSLLDNIVLNSYIVWALHAC